MEQREQRSIKTEINSKTQQQEIKNKSLNIELLFFQEFRRSDRRGHPRLLRRPVGPGGQGGDLHRAEEQDDADPSQESGTVRDSWICNAQCSLFLSASVLCPPPGDPPDPAERIHRLDGRQAV